MKHTINTIREVGVLHLQVWADEILVYMAPTDDELPKEGEDWHVLLPGAIACTTASVIEITNRTVVLSGDRCYPLISGDRRYPLNGGIQFIERAIPNIR